MVLRDGRRLHASANATPNERKNGTERSWNRRAIATDRRIGYHPRDLDGHFEVGNVRWSTKLAQRTATSACAAFGSRGLAATLCIAAKALQAMLSRRERRRDNEGDAVSLLTCHRARCARDS
jgi:hypothetical protein